MEEDEEKQLELIAEEFTKGIELFNKRECREAVKVFDGIMEQYKDSEYYSIVEVLGRSKVYKNICEARLHPVKIELNDDEDYLYNGLYHLNAGELDNAQERFDYLEEKKYDDPFLYYLKSLLYLKKEDKETCLSYLKKAIHKDGYYKIVAYNEPDFDRLSENEAFVSLIGH